MIAARSLAIQGEPLIYVGDPFGKSYAIMDSFQLHNHDGKPTMRLHKLRKVERSEAEQMARRLGISIPLADRQWYEVTSD